MADSNLLNRVRTCVRISTAIFDDEITPMISAAYEDLRGAGVDIDSADKSLTEQAVVFYCRAYFGTELKEDWAQQYEKLRNALAARNSEGS